MMKKLLAVLLVALLALSLFACSKDDPLTDTENTEEVEQQTPVITGVNYELTYGVNEEGDYQITGIVHDGKTPIDVIIPAEEESRPIVGVAAEAFKACKILRSVTFSDQTAYIGDAAFYDCDGLTAVTFNGSIKKIGALAFAECDALAAVTLKDGVETIGEFAFKNCKALTAVTLPASLLEIGQGAFRSCAELTALTIPTGVKTIGDMAFADCGKLVSVTAYGSPETLGQFLFANSAAGLTITGTQGTSFQAYATEHDLTFVVSDPSDPVIQDW